MIVTWLLRILTGLTPIGAFMWVWETDHNTAAAALRYVFGLFALVALAVGVLAWLALFGLRTIDARYAQRRRDDRAFAISAAARRPLPESSPTVDTAPVGDTAELKSPYDAR